MVVDGKKEVGTTRGSILVQPRLPNITQMEMGDIDISRLPIGIGVVTLDL